MGNENPSIVSLILAKRVQFYKGQIGNKFKQHADFEQTTAPTHEQKVEVQNNLPRSHDIKNRSYQLIQDFFSE